MNGVAGERNIEIINGIPVDWGKFKSKAKGWNLERAKQGYISFCELLYKNNHELLSDYMCAMPKVLIDFNCGHESHWISPNSYKHGRGCPKCAGKCPEQAKEDFVNMLSDNNHKLLSEYINVSTKVLIDFNCGHEPHWIKPNSYKNGVGCPKCKNKGEAALCDLLLDMGYEVDTQKSYSDLKDKTLLRYDFYLPKYNLLIELDGYHHRKAVSYKTTDMTELERDMADIDAEIRLYDRQKKDGLKDKYAKDNNIPLLRIEYNSKIELDKWKKLISDKIEEIKNNKIA